MKHKKVRLLVLWIALLCGFFTLFSCNNSNTSVKSSISSIEYSYFPVPVFYSENSQMYTGEKRIIASISSNTESDTGKVSVTIPRLNGQNVFLVRSNISGHEVGTGGKTGEIISWKKNDQKIVEFKKQQVVPAAIFTRLSRVDATREVLEAMHKKAGLSRASTWKPPQNPTGPWTAQDVGSVSKTFSSMGKDSALLTVKAKLYVRGEHCYVWLPEELFSNRSSSFTDNLLTQDQLIRLAKKFDAIYDSETTLFGYENGGGLLSSDSNYGGLDGDPRISILVYDIAADYSPDQAHGIFGYFDPTDQYAQSFTGNKCEMFYLDSHFLDIKPGIMYSTLIHEFQHMIHHAKYPYSDIWFNEMLSMLAEDILLPLVNSADDPIDLEKDSPASGRIPFFNAGYDVSGVTTWLSGDYEGEQSVLFSYASAYSFGAYLIRNFGGAELVYDIMQNDSRGIKSIGQALTKLYPDEYVSKAPELVFSEVFADYWQVLFFNATDSTENGLSYRSFETTPDDFILNDISYSVKGIDPWALDNIAAGYDRSLPKLPDAYGGPTIYNAESTSSSLLPWSFRAFSHEDWIGVHGTLIINLDISNLDPAVELHVVVK